jgi:CRISPR-associated exonuclease Cas4
MDEIPIAALNQYSYCPYRCYLMFVTCEFQDNAFTLEGTRLHTRVDTPGQGKRGDSIQFRSVWLHSAHYGLYGRADLIEERQGELYPVEYKRGSQGVWQNDHLQLCAQALCLEEMMDTAIPVAYLYYAQSHHREEVILNEALRQETLNIIDQIRALFRNTNPPAAIYSHRCKGCSLYPVCLPREMERARKYIAESSFDTNT